MQVTTEPTPQYFLAHARTYMDRTITHLDFARPLTAEEITLLIATFGTLPIVCTGIWERLRIYTDYTERNGAHPYHILWALLELKQHQTAIVTARSIVGVTEKTFSKWAWHFAEGIAYLEAHVILWENRLIGDLGKPAKTSFDGVHFRTKEPRPNGSFWNGHYSHKFKGSGLSYLVGLCIQTGHIVWVDGPWCAAVCDCKCFKRSGVMNYLEEGEKCEGDSHYQRNLKRIFIQRQGSDPVARRQADVVQARHEVINKLMRQFRALSHDAFRHNFERHSTAFRAIAVITQLNIESGHPLFQVQYN